MSDQQTKAPASKAPLIIFMVLFLASLALNLFLYFKYIKGQDFERNKQLASLLEEANLSNDSLQRELQNTIEQLQDQINENLAMDDLHNELRGDLESRLVELQRAKSKISRLIASGSSESYASSSPGSLGGAQALLQAKAEINKLKSENETYLGQVSEIQNQYRASQLALEDAESSAKKYQLSSDSLTKAAVVLEDRLEKTAFFLVSDLLISGIQEKKNKNIVTSKASKVDKLNISFNILENEAIEEGEKEIVIRILGTNNEVLTNDNNALTDTDQLVTMMETFNYDGETKKLTFKFKQKADFKKGMHKVEILSKGRLINSGRFTLY